MVVDPFTTQLYNAMVMVGADHTKKIEVENTVRHEQAKVYWDDTLDAIVIIIKDSGVPFDTDVAFFVPDDDENDGREDG